MDKDIEKKIKNILQNINIEFEGVRILPEKLINAYIAYLASTSTKNEHNVDLVLHTGSVIFDIIAIVHISLLNFLCNEAQSSSDFFENLQPNTMVVYNKERVLYKEKTVIKGANYIKLENTDTESTSFVREDHWDEIHPYGGTATKLGKQGVRESNNIPRAKLSKILSCADVKDLPNNIETSAVIVMQKQYADRLLNGIVIRIEKVKIKFLEIITAAFYTNSNRKIDYPGNTYKTEPMLKISSKLSTARKIISDRNSNNRNIGLIIVGDSQIKRSLSEIPEMMQKKSIQYMIINGTLNSDFAQDLIEEYSDLNFFACTKKLLQRYSVSETNNAKHTFNIQLANQSASILQHEVNAIVIPSKLSRENYRKIRDNLKIISKSDFENDDKKMFVIQAYSILKNLRTICVPLNYINKENINDKNGNLEEKLKRLNSFTVSFPNFLQEKANEIISLIQLFYNNLIKSNEKQNWLMAYIKGTNSEQNEKICIVVPNSNICALTQKYFNHYLKISNSNCVIKPINGIHQDDSYDTMVLVGLLESSRFDAFKTLSAKKIKILVYDFAEYQFKKRKIQNNKRENFYNSNLAKIYKKDVSFFEANEETTEDIEEDNMELDSEIEAYISNANENFLFKSESTYHTNTTNSMSECLLLVTFETYEKCLFSKTYKPYVFSEDTGAVKETELNDLLEGDNIVFTKRSNKTSDVVEDILEKLIDEKKYPKEIEDAYKQSKYWKKVLRDYKRANFISVSQLSRRLKLLGINVQEDTIKQWLTPESHTVGPRDENTFRIIGQLVEDDNLINNYSRFTTSCETIRKARRKILSIIGEAIINKLQNKEPPKGSVLFDVYDKLDDLAEILKVQTIQRIERLIPSNFANRPLNLRNEL